MLRKFSEGNFLMYFAIYYLKPIQWPPLSTFKKQNVGVRRTKKEENKSFSVNNMLCHWVFLIVGTLNANKHNKQKVILNTYK